MVRGRGCSVVPPHLAGASFQPIHPCALGRAGGNTGGWVGGTAGPGNLFALVIFSLGPSAAGATSSGPVATPGPAQLCQSPAKAARSPSLGAGSWRFRLH